MAAPIYHIIYSLIIFDILSYRFPKKEYLIIMGAGILGSILPDMDYIFELATRFGIATFPETLFHWGVMHTVTFACIPFFLGLFILLIRLGPRYKTVGLFCLILSLSIVLHLGFDMLFAFTAESGLALFYPFSTTEFYYHANDIDMFRIGFEVYTAGLLLLWLLGKGLLYKKSKQL